MSAGHVLQGSMTRKQKAKFDHSDLIKFRVKKAKQKVASLAELPPCESIILQNDL